LVHARDRRNHQSRCATRAMGLSRKHYGHGDCKRLAESHCISKDGSLERITSDAKQFCSVLHLMLVGLAGHSWKLNHTPSSDKINGSIAFISVCRAVSVRAQLYYFAVTYDQLRVLLSKVSTSIDKLAVTREISIAFGVGLGIKHQISRLQRILRSGGDMILVNGMSSTPLSSISITSASSPRSTSAVLSLELTM
jgi:hypothetical protein